MLKHLFRGAYYGQVKGELGNIVSVSLSLVPWIVTPYPKYSGLGRVVILGRVE